jgi:peptidoglycan hydrolase CwlO-like protein
MKRDVNTILLILVVVLSVSLAVVVMYNENAYLELRQRYQAENQELIDQYNQLSNDYAEALAKIEELESENEELRKALVEKEQYIKELEGTTGK